ncbi:hypothetical protein [Vibrio cyclitrophicus]|uniref:hypothetical protein n=1 Tax=Vibrio cyclitrophicus TaxID=47951 RepID=UPI0011B392E1|nr:hypothetical protein [Vibrio cyclitrophicus]
MQTKESEITFNTGRGYSSSGQQIHAKIIEDTGETLHVRFSDQTRGIDGEIEVSELTATNMMQVNIKGCDGYEFRHLKHYRRDTG